jgi:Protein of unknown function (DUF2971)
MVEPISDSSSFEQRLNHPSFTQPENKQIKVWRYMDLGKLIWLLDEKQLFMPRLDKLTDPFEGSLTSKTIDGIKTYVEQNKTKTTSEEILDMYRQFRCSTYTCCWHANEQESEAMWRLYCGNEAGIAIQTTYNNLANLIKNEHDVYIGLVQYIDYENHVFPGANSFYPVMHKRLSFQHEHEVRLVSYRPLAQSEPCPEGISVTIDLPTTIKQIYIHPSAPEYYFEVVKAILSKFEPSLESKIKWSRLRDSPYI